MCERSGHRAEAGYLGRCQRRQHLPLKLRHGRPNAARRLLASGCKCDQERAAIDWVNLADEQPSAFQPIQHACQRGRPGAGRRSEFADRASTAVSQDGEHVLLRRGEVKVRECVAQGVHGRVSGPL